MNLVHYPTTGSVYICFSMISNKETILLFLITVVFMFMKYAGINQ